MGTKLGPVGEVGTVGEVVYSPSNKDNYKRSYSLVSSTERRSNNKPNTMKHISYINGVHKPETVGRERVCVCNSASIESRENVCAVSSAPSAQVTWLL